MKLSKLFAAFMLIGAVALTACHTVPEDPDGPNKPGKDTTTVDPNQPGETIDWSAANLPDGAITVAKAREIASGLASEQVTSETYYVYGIVKKLHSKHTQETIDQYGNGSFYMVDKTGDSDDFLAYQVYGLNKQKFTSVDQVEVGDLVVICCHITNYNGTLETAGKGDGYLYWSSNAKAGESTTPGGNDTPDPDGLVGDGSEANPYTVGDILTLNNTKTGNYFVKGFIVGQIKGDATSAKNNCEFEAPFTANANGENTNLLIAAAAGDTAQAHIAFIQLPTGFLRDALNLIAHPENLGKEVVIYGSLEKYFGGVGVKNMTRAWIDGEEIILEIGDVPAATVATVAEFNAAPVNTTVEGVWYELTGTIGGTINTTYGNFDLTDETGTVYVYGLVASYLPLSSATKANNDKSYASLNLVAGDNVTIRGVRAEYNGKIEVLGAYFVRKNN